MHEVRFIESESAIIEAGAGAIVRPWVGSDDGLFYISDAAATAANAANNANTQNAEYTGDLQYSGAQGTGADEAANINSAKFDVYPILFPSKDAFATIGLKGKDRITFAAQDPSKISLTNPYGTKGFFSGNFFYASVILEPEKLLRLDTLVTA